MQHTDSSGNDLGATIQNVTKDNCEALCSTNPSCYGFTYNTINTPPTCQLKKSNMMESNSFDGVNLYVKNNNLLVNITNIEALNSKLIVLNQKIIEQLKDIQPNAIVLDSENKKKLIQAETVYNELLDEKNKIEKMKIEDRSINTESVFSKNNLNHQYAQYIFWIILVLLILLITFKTLLFPDSAADPLKFFFWVFISIFLFISTLYSYLPTGFLILCVIVSYICLGFTGILPLP